MEQSIENYSKSEWSKCILAESLISAGENVFDAMKSAGLSDKVIEGCREGRITLEVYKQRQFDFIK